jgi:GNAT superfamily N-acetyltransferase
VPLRFEAPGTRLDGLMIAFDHDAAVGMCQLTCPAGRRWAFIEMTGVLRPYRGRGLATAMKLRALQAARSWGCSEVRTFHNPKNLAISPPIGPLASARPTSICDIAACLPGVQPKCNESLRSRLSSKK